MHLTCFIQHVVHRIILDEAALFLSDKSNAVSVNLARGKFTSVMILKKLLEMFQCSFDLCLLLDFCHRLCSSGRHGNIRVEDYSCQTWGRWKVGKHCLPLHYINVLNFSSSKVG